MARKTPFAATSSSSWENIVFCLQGLLTSQGQTDLLYPYFPDAQSSQALNRATPQDNCITFWAMCPLIPSFKCLLQPFI